jgi:hypothetical protein
MKILPDYFEQLAKGESYQDKVARRIKQEFDYDIHFYKSKRDQYEIGESAEGIEIKYDSWISRSGRMSIEVAEKTRADLPEFTPSGIFRQDNTRYYLQGDDNFVWCFAKIVLQEYYRINKPKTIDDNPPTIRKFYISIAQADALAWRKVKL